MNGSVAILNVGAGDTRLSFDRTNPAEVIRSARIVKDMLRRGYALLVEVERNGAKAFERALDFREDTGEYIIADFDPVSAQAADTQEQRRGLDDGPSIKDEAGDADSVAPNPPPTKQARGKGRKSIPASRTRAVAVARSAGG